MEAMHIRSRSAVKFLVVLAAAACLTVGMNLASAGNEDEGALQRALERYASVEGSAPGIIVVVARGQSIDVHTAGYANLESKRAIHIHDHMRLASVAKAFSGAAALSLVASDGPSRASLVGYIAPVFSIFYGVVLLDESFTVATAAGLALILGGSWLAAGGQLPARRRDVAAADQPHGGPDSPLLERGPERGDRVAA